MNEGLKRHIKYISMYQRKIFSIIILGTLICGLFLAVMNNATPDDIVNYMEMVLIIAPCSLMLNYIRYQIDFSLSMGCTRRNIYLGIYILAAEILLESLTVFLLLQAVTFTPINPDRILSFLISELISCVFGVLNGLLIRRFGYTKMMLVLILFYIALCLFSLNSFFLFTNILTDLSGRLLMIGGILILYGLIVTLFGKRVINKMQQRK